MLLRSSAADGVKGMTRRWFIKNGFDHRSDFCHIATVRMLTFSLIQVGLVWEKRRFFCTLIGFCFAAAQAHAQSISIPWTGHAHDPQHTGISQFSAQPMNRILWQTPV